MELPFILLEHHELLFFTLSLFLSTIVSILTSVAVQKELCESMDEYGWLIVKALVTDIDPDTRVKASMNEINAAQRLREAAKDKAEAQKISVVKQAEAEAESKYTSLT